MAGTETPNYGLYKPLFDEEGWDDEINENFDIIDAELKAHLDAIALRATIADLTALANSLTGKLLPVPTGNANKSILSDGSSWAPWMPYHRWTSVQSDTQLGTKTESVTSPTTVPASDTILNYTRLTAIPIPSRFKAGSIFRLKFDTTISGAGQGRFRIATSKALLVQVLAGTTPYSGFQTDGEVFSQFFTTETSWTAKSVDYTLPCDGPCYIILGVATNSPGISHSIRNPKICGTISIADDTADPTFVW